MEYTIKFKFSNNSAINIIPFENFGELAVASAPFVQSGAVAISGGSTYDKLFEAWAQLPNFGEEAIFFPVDERVVSIDHPDSNWGNACKKLFTPLGITGQCNNIALSVADYTQLLTDYFEKSTYQFSSVFLGVGDDGHTASLFPGDTESLESTCQVLATESPKGIKERITLGSSVLLATDNLITILAGNNKEQCIDWLVAEDTSRPFVAILKQKQSSTLYLHKPLYDYLKKVS